ncbi:MAG: glycosyltransferase [Chitinophagales bacterium]
MIRISLSSAPDSTVFFSIHQSPEKLSRIVFTVVNDLTYDQRMRRISRSLAEAGYEVLLIGRKLKSSVPLSNEIFRQHRLTLLFRKGKLFYLEYNLRLFFYLLFQKFDVAGGIDLDTILPCYFISKLKGKKCVYDAHELFTEVPEVIRRPFTQSIWRWVEKYAIHRIKNCYTVSEGLANYFQQRYACKFEVVRNVPLLEESFSNGRSDKRERFIFYQGALNEGRGLEHLITAIQSVPMKLKLAGEGDLSVQLRNLVEESRLTEKVEFLGRKLPDELKYFTRESFIGVNLLENKGLSYYYSLANKFFDYVHAGIPVITMNFPEYVHLNQQYNVAVLVNDLQTDTLVNAITQLSDNKDAYFRLQENCFRARHEWNWQKEEQKLISFYQSLK